MAPSKKEKIGSKFRGTTAWNSMVWFIFISFLTIYATSYGMEEKFINHKNARRKLDDIGGTYICIYVCYFS